MSVFVQLCRKYCIKHSYFCSWSWSLLKWRPENRKEERKPGAGERKLDFHHLNIHYIWLNDFNNLFLGCSINFQLSIWSFTLVLNLGIFKTSVIVITLFKQTEKWLDIQIKGIKNNKETSEFSISVSKQLQKLKAVIIKINQCTQLWLKKLNSTNFVF